MVIVSTQAVRNRDQAMRRLGHLPPFSPLLNRLLATMGQEDVSFSELAGLIEKDTVLAGNVLRLVNSALYGLRGTVNSVRHAVSLMGLTKLRNAALSLSIAQLWNRVHTPGSWSSQRFNRHSVAAGLLADLMAQRLPVDYAEGAFTAGLLHDVGKLIMAVTFLDEYEAILAHDGRPEDECELLGFDHAELSAEALKRWNLPLPIREAVAHHHAPRAGPDGLRSLEEIVAGADRLAHALGLAAGPSESGEDPMNVLADLGIEDERLMEEFAAEFQGVAEFF